MPNANSTGSEFCKPLCHVQFDNTDLSYANFNESTLDKINFTSKTILIRSSCSQPQLSISALFGVAGKYKEGTVEISSPTVRAYFESPYINSSNGQLQWFYAEEQFEILKETRYLYIDLEINGNDDLCLVDSIEIRVQRLLNN
ncbi:unnamed protein product [Rotaria sordida]|uniref:Uncharacterized protein n=1 Tax=Rotaria sordida TaxID=392033 RepID=A0A819RH72_9BILA|nr:unnamed protein product [Rotaria sordida]